MGINLTNFLSSKSKNTKMIDFQDLDHLNGISISVVSADLYKDPRDDLTMFYFREGANHASVYTQSKILSENIKWKICHWITRYEYVQSTRIELGKTIS